MEKMKMHSPNFAEENIEKLAVLFPNCVTETEDENGELKKAIDFDLLRQELSTNIVEGPQERYRLDWPGKREALLTANAPIAKTLRPYRDESVNFDKTENLFIEGDNLDALKLLQETYLGKIKLIYIDPPYNTGKDFIYDDDFAESTEDYLLESQQKDSGGNRLIANTESNGRFHSDWLSMMYSRLKLAKNLLTDDGAIAISIDDNESHNCIKICNEVFGEKNIIATIANTNNPKGRSDDKYVATAHEYIVIFSKDIEKFNAYGFEPGENILSRYNKTDESGEKYREIDLRKTGDNDLREDRPNLFYYFHFNEQTGDFYPSQEEKAPAGYISIFPQRSDGREGNWRWGISTAQKQLSDLIPKYMPNRKIWGVMEKDMLSKRGAVKATSSWTFKDVNSERGSEIFINLGFDKRIFPKPKPLGTIKRICQVCLAPKSNDLVFDFFAGSATTAHAIMQLNAEDGGKRKFILSQLPEVCEKESPAYKSGYSTIAEISKERIRRAGKAIKAETGFSATDLDTGFRVLKTDTSCMADVYYSPNSTKQDLLAIATDNIKADRSTEDLIFQVLLDWGVDLTLPIIKESIEDNEVFFVDGNALAACFAKDGEVSEDFCKKLAEREPLRVVFRDAGFKDDNAKINIEQIFKLMSPHTEVKTI
jgi:adenine-specific DNA-methyltransferase